MKLHLTLLAALATALLLLAAAPPAFAQAPIAFANTGSLGTPRSSPTATLLPNGQVLVAGGYNDNDGILASAELYDPASGMWAATGSLNTARVSHTATLLPSGQVLVVGGSGDTSAELYDPVSGLWTTTTGSLATARDSHTATLLPNGQVLVAGGYNDNDGILASAELYDPVSGMWTTTTGSLGTARDSHTATLLPNGQVLVAGGFDSDSNLLASAELYDPATKMWTTTGSLATARYSHTATLLPNGQVLVAGGYNDNDGILASAEIFDPAGNGGAGTWTATGSLGTARSYGHTATLLPNGQVLVAGGYGNSGKLASAELYDPASGTWTATGSLATARYFHTATLLPNGQVLVAGGYDSNKNSLASAELYGPEAYYRVTGNADDGLGTVDTTHAGTPADPYLATELRAALDAANAAGSGIIMFDPALAGQTITLNGTELDVTGNVTIAGLGANQLTVDANYESRVFLISNGTTSGPTVIISGLTIANGTLNGQNGPGIYNDHGLLAVNSCTLSGNSASPGSGGGIFNDGGGSGSATLNITNSTLSQNIGDFGAGVFNEGRGGSATLNIANSTFSQNSGPAAGGAIATYTDNGSDIVSIANSTFSQNSAPTGGGIIISGTTLQIGNTILNNGAPGGNIDNESGTVTSLGYNLSSDDGGGLLTSTGDQINTDPQLSPLQDNGGPTLTFAPLAGSPVIDQGNRNTIPALATNTDQRGYVRPINSGIPFSTGGDGSDIGAEEYNSADPTPPVLTLSPVVAAATSSAGAAVQFTLSAQDAQDGALTPTATPASGSVFPLGDTTVKVSVTDSAGLTANGSFVVAVLPGFTDPTGGQAVSSTEAPLDLSTGVTPMGGTFSGTGVTEAGIFDPSLVSPGTYTITYMVNGVSSMITITVAAVVYRVTGNADDGLGTVDTAHAGTLADPYLATELRAALDATNAAGIGTIVFDPALAGQTITLNGTELDVTGDVTITGLGANKLTVDANNASRVFYIGNGTYSGPTVSISGLTIANGNVSDAGGGIYNDHGALTITNSTFSQNAAPDNIGGGIYNDGNNGGGSATLTITNSTFSQNSASDGGGIYNDHGALTITSSTFSQNSAPDDVGGGIYNDSEGGGSATLTITNSTFSLNFASDGGGIYNDGYYHGSATLTIANSTFSQNSADSGQGGGIYNFGEFGSATLTIANSTFSQNSAGEGGGIYNNGVYYGSATLTIANSTFSQNSANSGRGGGGIFNDGGDHGSATLSITNSTVSQNSADEGGGGIYNNGDGGSATFQIGNTILTTGASGENIVNQSGKVVSLGYNLSNDAGGGFLTDPTDILKTDPLLDPAGLRDNGGPTKTIRLLAGSPAIDQGKRDTIPALAANTDQRGHVRPINSGISFPAGGDGSDIGAEEYNAADPTPPVLKLSPVVATATSAAGAAVQFTLSANDAQDGMLTPTATPASGSVFPFGDTTVKVSVTDSAGFTTNGSFVVTVLPGFTDPTGGQAVSSAVTSLDLSKAVTPTGGTFSGTGVTEAGIFDPSQVGPGTYTITYMFNGASSTITITVAAIVYRVTGNADDGLGTVDTAHAGTLADPYLATELRAALDAANTAGSGIIEFDPALAGQTITLNGTELDITGNITIIGLGANKLTVDANYASRVFSISNGTSSGPTASISGLTIAHGSSYYGGGIYNDHGALTITSSTFSQNSASGGGGICNDGEGDGSTSLSITNSTFSQNSAAIYGGGIYNDGASGSTTLSIANSTFSQNSAYIGGGIDNYGGGGSATLSIANSTFSQNSANDGGGGIYNNGDGGSATFQIGNTILTTGASGENIYNQSGTVASLGYNLSNDDGGGFLTDPTDILKTDPQLGPLQGNGGPTGTLAPLAGSPAIDHGKRDTIPALAANTDQRGHVRPINSGISFPAGGDGSDIGAVEYNAADPTPPVLKLSPVIAAATSAAGAVVQFTLSAHDAQDGTLVPTATPPSGSLFPFGDTTVTVSVTDSAGLTANGSFVVTVQPGFTNPTGSRTVYSTAAPVDLKTGVTPSGGMFSGDGVTSDGIFYPSLVGPGVHTITYTFNGVSSTITLTVTVVPYDFNGDGHPDFLLFNPATRQSAQWNLSGPAFVASATGPTAPAGWMVVAAADFYSDGQPDWVLFKASTHQTAIWYMNGATHMGGDFGPTLPTGYALVGVADFDGDGNPDYLLFNATTLETMIYYLQGPNLDHAVIGPTLPKGWEVVGTGDFDGDGQLDLLLFNATTRQTAIWYMNGPTHMGGANGPTLPDGWAVDSIADFNGDGHPDYLLFNAATNQMAVWFLNGATHMGGMYVPTMPPGWTLETAADFNADGKPDYLLVNDATGETAVWYGNGTPFAQAANGPTAKAGWALVGAADFNGDGEPDYLLFNASTRQTAIWYMNGPNRLSTVYGPNVDAAGWALVGAADFNGDGHPDYLLFNASTRQTAIWYMNGANVISKVYGPTVGEAGWALVGAADFNGDGHPDLLFFDATSGKTAIWYMNGPNLISKVYGPMLSPGWALVGSEDFNADGQPDLLLFNATTNQTAIWYMNGVAHAGGAFGPNVPTGWSLIAH